MCLPLQLSHGASPYILLFHPDIQIGTCISVNTFLPLMPSSHFLFLMEPFSLQPRASAHLSYPSSLTGYKATPPPGCIPGNPRALLPPCYQHSFLRTLCGLPSGPHRRHCLESSISGLLSFDFCQSRAEVPGI